MSPHPESYVHRCDWAGYQEYRDYVGHRIKRMNTSGYRLPKTYAGYHDLPQLPRPNLKGQGMEELRDASKQFSQ